MSTSAIPLGWALDASAMELFPDRLGDRTVERTNPPGGGGDHRLAPIRTRS
ncbi:MAG: hypothetical protein ACO3PD_05660 [Acidimicrobiales bacterium]